MQETLRQAKQQRLAAEQQEAAEAAALVLARGLRQRGLAVELDGSGSAFGKQFKRADRSGAAWAAVLGDGELAEGVVRLKPLRADSEAGAGDQLLPLADLGAVAQLLA
jgi:histidyl-tRNA synthetase